MTRRAYANMAMFLALSIGGTAALALSTGEGAQIQPGDLSGGSYDRAYTDRSSRSHRWIVVPSTSTTSTTAPSMTAARRSSGGATRPPAPQHSALTPERIEAILRCIQPKENRSGDPALDHPGSSTASGLFGYLDGTWNGWGGVSRAMYAPAEVQWQRARYDASKGYGQIRQNWPSTSRNCI